MGTEILENGLIKCVTNMKPIVIKGHLHVLRSDGNLLTIHTKQNLIKGMIIQLGQRLVPVISVKFDESKYYSGFNFYEVNFKDK